MSTIHDFMPHDPRDHAVLDPATLRNAGIPAYVAALEACLAGEDRIADRCSACDLPRAWHFDSSQILLMGCDFAQRVSLRPELRTPRSGVVLPLDREPTVTRRVFDALRAGRCGGPLTALLSGCTHDEILVLARELTNTVIAAQQEGSDAA